MRTHVQYYKNISKIAPGGGDAALESPSSKNKSRMLEAASKRKSQNEGGENRKTFTSSSHHLHSIGLEHLPVRTEDGKHRDALNT
jgi:hypothetical protein